MRSASNLVLVLASLGITACAVEGMSGDDVPTPNTDRPNVRGADVPNPQENDVPNGMGPFDVPSVEFDVPTPDPVDVPDPQRDVPNVQGRDVPNAPVDVPNGGMQMGVGTSVRWHIDLEAPVRTDIPADVYDIDLFDNTAATIRTIKAGGRRVICYFSAGSYENWRPDEASFPRAGLGSNLDGWPGERWLDVRNAGVRTVMQRRMDLAVMKGCDGVDPDNVDGYANANGFNLTSAHQLDYNRFLAREAHARHLVIGLKNDLDQIPQLVTDFDFAINEQCFNYNECDRLAPFTRAGKSVLNIEYGTIATLRRTVCPAAMMRSFFSILPGADRLTGSYTRCLDGMAF